MGDHLVPKLHRHVTSGGSLPDTASAISATGVMYPSQLVLGPFAKAEEGRPSCLLCSHPLGFSPFIATDDQSPRKFCFPSTKLEEADRL